MSIQNNVNIAVTIECGDSFMFLPNRVMIVPVMLLINVLMLSNSMPNLMKIYL